MLKKLILSFSIFIVITIVIIVISYTALVGTIDSFSNFYEHGYTVSNIVRTIKADIEDIHLAMRNMALEGSSALIADEIDMINASVSKINGEVAQLENEYLGDLSEIEDFKNDFYSWLNLKSQLIACIQKDDVIQARIIAMNEDVEYLRSMKSAIDRFIDFTQNGADHYYKDSIHIADDSKLFIVIIAGLSIIVSLILAFRLTRDIHHPIKEITSAIQKIRNGDEAPVIAIKRKDELGVMADAFSDMTAYLRTKRELDQLALRLENELSREELRITLKSIGDAALSTDTSGRILTMNPVAEALTGWTISDAKGRSSKEVFRIINEETKMPCVSPIDRVLKEGVVVGLANHTALVSRDGHEIPIADSAAPIRDDSGRIHGVVLVFRDITEENRKQQEILHLSFHDALTGLYNRRFFEEEETRLDTERNLPISVIYGDVNGLKLVNDALGHKYGDIVLSSVADIMKKSCRREDIITRWGGDEFIILLPSTGPKEAAAIANRIKKAVSTVEVHSLKISISLGVETKRLMTESLSSVRKKAEDYMYRNKLIETSSLRGNVINTILATLHDKDPMEKGHSERVRELCRKTGEAMGLGEAEVNELEIAGFMHDIGKIAVDNNAYYGKENPTDKEREDIMRHPEIGYRILSSSKEMSDIAGYILSHHERIDGKGYPKGITGNQIPLQSCILAVADAYDEMVTGRPGRPARTKEQAIAELKENSGTQFDPDVIDAFLKKVI